VAIPGMLDQNAIHSRMGIRHSVVDLPNNKNVAGAEKFLFIFS
jgi:hypothetical protein